MKVCLFSLFFSALAGVASAETLRSDLPPINGEVSSFTDARGCVFVRATVGGWTLWVQQIGSEQRTGCVTRPSRTEVKPKAA